MRTCVRFSIGGLGDGFGLGRRLWLRRRAGRATLDAAHGEVAHDAVGDAEDARQLLERLRNGDERAFDVIFRTWYPSLVRSAESIARSRALAEELVQDVMLELWRRRDGRGADGRDLPGTFFAHYLKEFDHAIKKFQVVQEEKNAMIFRIVKGGRYSDDVLQEVLNTFREYLGQDMKLSLIHISEPTRPY